MTKNEQTTMDDALDQSEDATPAPMPMGSVSLEEIGVSFSRGGYFLTKEERDAIVDSDATFDVYDVRYEIDAEYGPRYVLTIRPSDDPNALGRGWTFSADERMAPRSEQLARIMAALREGAGRIGPVRFIHPINKKGKMARTVVLTSAAPSNEPF